MCLSSPKRFGSSTKATGQRGYKSRTPRQCLKHGRWEKWERMAFLEGFRRFGRGKWKQIGTLIPTRTTIQVKTHAQMVLKRMELGEDVFDELDEWLGGCESVGFGPEVPPDEMELFKGRQSSLLCARQNAIRHSSQCHHMPFEETLNPCIEGQDVQAALILAYLRQDNRW